MNRKTKVIIFLTFLILALNWLEDLNVLTY